ncbi:MAG TPA: hypothetical protein ENN09_03705 [Planctomycetes bacterium]|nr:hypothetical protein [Planctomycetota bacterium]
MPVKDRPIVDEDGGTRRPVSLVAVIFFVAVVFFVPGSQLVWELASGERLQEFDIFFQRPSLSNIKLYEDVLAQSSRVADIVRPGVQWLQLYTLRQGNEKVVVGRDGFLFYRPGIAYSTGPGFRSKYALDAAQAKHPDPLPAILDFHSQLKELNIDLVIVPVPTKAQIYPEKLNPSYDLSLGPPINVHQPEFFAELEKNGIPVIDLAGALWNAKSAGDAVYMPLDTHWTPRGMSIFAAALADELKKRYEWLGEPEKKYAASPLSVTNHGDLYDLLKLPASSPLFPEYTCTVEQVEDEESGEWALSDPDAPIVLLGDSFANVFSVGAMKWGDHAGLGQHLMLHLGRPVHVIAVNGGAPTVTRRNLSRSGNVSRKKLVVWEFVTRELIDPASEWEPVQVTGVKQAVSQNPVKMEARVIAVSRPPRPGEDPYAHCVTFSRYKVLSVLSGEYEGDELLAVQWVMRNFKLLPAAKFRPGDVHRMVLVPFRPDIHPDLQQSKETDDTGDLTHQPYWVVEMKE